MLTKDKNLIETYERKNQLQSLIYSSKDKLSEEAYKELLSLEQLDQHMGILNREGEWLYEETGFVPKMAYEVKIKII